MHKAVLTKRAASIAAAVEIIETAVEWAPPGSFLHRGKLIPERGKSVRGRRAELRKRVLEMSCSKTIQKLIGNAWGDGCPCLLGTSGPDGPNISAKGSMLLFDDEHLGYWERSKFKALENLKGDNRVVVFYSNMKAQLDGIVPSGFLRFYGKAELHETGPIRDAIFARLSEREQTHAGADAGIGVLIKIDRAVDAYGNSIL